MSGKMLAPETASSMISAVGAPPPSGVSSMTRDLTSLMSPASDRHCLNLHEAQRDRVEVRRLRILVLNDGRASIAAPSW